MQITSYFIWLELKENFLKNIFFELKDFVKKNNYENILQVEEWKNFHITLYYLIKNLENIEEIKNFIKNLKLEEEIFLDDLKYFYRENKEFIWYFSIKSKNNFFKVNEILNKKFKKYSAEDNKLDFIPHITIFRIKNYEKFLKIKNKLENFIKNRIFEKNINSKKIFLYKVDSTKSPEVQEKICS